MVAVDTLLNSKMTTAPTKSLINNIDWKQQHQLCADNNILKSLNLTSTKMKNNEDRNVQQHQLDIKTDIEDIDCRASLDAYDGETSNNSVDWKSFRWSPEATRLMLRLRFERQIEFQMRNRQKKDLWAEIALEMRKEGNYHTTGEVCDLKYRNMLQTYKKNYLKEERGMQSHIVWEYYELFKEAMKACAAGSDDLVPSQLCDTICENGEPLLEETVKEEDDFNEDEDVSECMETSNNNPKIIIDDGAMKTDNNIIPPKRRAPSARVQANNNKRYRLSSSITNLETTGKATEFDWSQLPPLEPKPDVVGVTTGNTSQPHINQTVPSLQNYSRTHNNNSHNHNNNYPLPPPWLTDSELREYFAFGESVGLQIAHVRDPRTRAFLQLKIQETLFLAKVGRLTE